MNESIRRWQTGPTTRSGNATALWRSAFSAFVLAAALGTGGCATQTLQQGTDFARAGTDYSDAVVGFLDVYLNTRIDVNSRRALEDRRTRLDAQLGSELDGTLKRYDASVLATIRETAQLRENVRLLKAYFENLNALATSNLPDEGGAALKSLGSAISNLNAATGGSANALNAEQLGYVERIGKLAVKAAVAHKIRAALERDKEVIARQLALQEIMLHTLVKPVREEYERQLAAMHGEKVVAVYVSATGRPESGWMEDRRNWAKSTFFVQSFERSEQAAAHMRAVWEDILSGQTDIHSMRLMLADLREFTAIVSSFDAAEKKK